MSTTYLTPFETIESCQPLKSLYRTVTDKWLHDALHDAKARHLAPEIYWLEYEIVRRRCLNESV